MDPQCPSECPHSIPSVHQCCYLSSTKRKNISPSPTTEEVRRWFCTLDPHREWEKTGILFLRAAFKTHCVLIISSLARFRLMLFHCGTGFGPVLRALLYSVCFIVCLSV